MVLQRGSDKAEKQKQLQNVLRFFKKEYGISPSEILHIIKAKEKEEKELQSYFIPVSLFSVTPLSSLEAITVYLHDIKQIRFSFMQKILARNQIVLSTTYRNAKKKYQQTIIVPESRYFIPCSIFRNKANRDLSILENIVFYLKSEYNLPNYLIAKLLAKDQRTIWTVLHRVKQKVKKK